ncbi:MAG: UvrD-helicase domain-containing protein [Candidatus Aenigmatarchaeota archaeon]
MKNSSKQTSEVIVVEASAGTGKTFTLAKHYLSLVIGPHIKAEEIPLKNILAITFTNKAAIEMKERILELLKKIALNKFDCEEEKQDILNTLKMKEDSAQSKALFTMEKIIKHYNLFQIQTIDSFINTLLFGCALNIGRSGNFKIKKDYRQLLLYCLDLAIDEALKKEKTLKLLEEFLINYLFVENRSGWFPKEDILNFIVFLFQIVNRYKCNFKINKVDIKEIIEIKKDILKSLKEIYLSLPQNINNKIKNTIKDFLVKNKTNFHIEDLHKIFKNKEFSINKNIPLEFKKKLEKNYKKINKLVELEAKVACNPYIKFFNLIWEYFQRFSKKEDILFLEELNKQAQALFDQSGITVAELYYRLATRFKHFLIDEFQDTSVLQWENLKPMIEDILANGGSLFYVGDKKQAIYRFRGGEVELFDKIKKDFSNFNIKNLHLTKNRRSQKNIIEFNNRLFSAENLIRLLEYSKINEEIKHIKNAKEEILKIFKDAIQNYNESTNLNGYVRVEFLNEENQEQRNQILRPKLISLIKDLNKRFKYEDIAILTKDNSEVELLSSWLLEENIPVESDKTLNVLENHLVKEIISFLKFLYSPTDNISFASFILGDIFSSITKIPTNEIMSFLFEININNLQKQEKTLYTLFRKKYKNIWNEYFEFFLKNVGFISLYELLIEIYERFNILKNFPSQLAFFMKLLNLTKEKEEEYMDLGEFLDYLKKANLEDLYVTVTHSDRIKILTIHKSKGLEFPVVIIPFLRIEIIPQVGGRSFSFYINEKNGKLELLKIIKPYRECSLNLQKIYSQHYFKSFVDELNTVYVALTRPKFELYIFVPKKSGNLENKAIYLFNNQNKETLEYGQQINYFNLENQRIQNSIEIKPSTYRSWVDILKEEFIDFEDLKFREKIMEGNAFHFALSFIKNLNQQKKEEVIKLAIENTKLVYPFIKDFNAFREKIKKMLDNKKLTQFFYLEDAEVYLEKEVIDDLGNTKRIDRIIVKKEEVWIVDYKLKETFKEAYKKQVLDYMKILNRMYTSCKIRGFIIYLDNEEIEEIYG